ncbi:hypothetical protein E8E11_010376 [Didymella keratinophila]|nr:hypothetical protein E8E11_010376 [Didymella keratinophila]
MLADSDARTALTLNARLLASGEAPNPDRISVVDETSRRPPNGDLWRDSRSGIAITLRSIRHLRLLGLREARHTAGLDTLEIDEEITRRVVLQPQMWPEVYELVRRSGLLPRRSMRGEVAPRDEETVDASEVRVERAVMRAACLVRMRAQLERQLANPDEDTSLNEETSADEE